MPLTAHPGRHFWKHGRLTRCTEAGSYHVTVDNSLQVIINSSGAFALADDLVAVQKKIGAWEPIWESMANELRLARIMHLTNKFHAPLATDDASTDYLVDDDGSPVLADWSYVIGGQSETTPPSGKGGNYEELSNLPQINGTKLIGNKSFDDLGLHVATAQEIVDEFSKGTEEGE